MKKTYFNLHLLNSIILLFFHLPLDTIGQNAIVKGSIIDAEEKESRDRKHTLVPVSEGARLPP